MTPKLMGKKRGMIQLFDENGNSIVGTVIEVQPNAIVQIKKKEIDGYNAIQIGFDKIHVKDQRTLANRLSKPLRGHYSKAAVSPRKNLSEAKVDNIEQYQVGQELAIDLFADVKFVDATAVSKGKGYQGTMKKYNYSGGPASHGSGFHRHAGSTGMRSTPGRSLPNSPRPSHMGCETVTIQNLEVVMVKPAEQVIIVKGAVPGPTHGLVYIAPSVKKTSLKKAS
ncbi:50S ribosomal protein L3 [Neochlamydia sp. S13]|uniref:50S ribosomal protein L3 n=1 Tax=Neochlamydia sp. S13 TaxID=1353976 RepID=UPI0005A80542|nr:50S ribosomal protein L3 [Neochlamydia sp. S13]BBI17305.1 50S ribosomal protein L3 [Neochlamydia sp. S13]